MKHSRKDTRCSTPRIPEIRFEEQALTSFSGLVLIQKLFQVLRLKERLRECVRHLQSATSYHSGSILLVLVVHLTLGWRRLRDLDYYWRDPLVLRALGLRRLPSVSTLSRGLKTLDAGVIERLRRLLQDLVLEDLVALFARRLTLDFDGSVLSTKSRKTEGTSVGYNAKSKGNRSYYALLATVAQTGQVFDLLHRPGNVHDSNGAKGFIGSCMQRLRKSGFRGVIESRLDGAHFSDETCSWLDRNQVEFSVSVPFERLPRLKDIVERRKRWRRIDADWSAFEVK